MTVDERRAWVAKRDATKMRAADSARYARDKPKRLAAQRLYKGTESGREALTRGNREWRRRNPAKMAAHNAVARALRDGRLAKGQCERLSDDCAGKIHAHHDDYTKPLNVRWLCRAHHHQLHINQGDRT